MQAGKCYSCDARILWVRSAKTGGLMPLDAEPCEDGNIVLDEQGLAHVLTKSLFEAEVQGVRYKSHFADCPNAAKHRKKAKK